MSAGASVLHTEVRRVGGSADRGLTAHRVCRPTTAVGIRSAHRGLWGHPVCRHRSDCLGIGSTDRGPVGVSGLQTEVQWGHRGRRLKSVVASGTETEVCVGTWSADSLREHRLCRQRSAEASVLHTEVGRVGGSADRGLWAHRFCRPTTAVGIGSADRGLWLHRDWRQRSAGASGLQTQSAPASDLQTEICWGQWVCRQRSFCASGLQIGVYVGIVSEERGLWWHLFNRQGLWGIRSAKT